MKRFPLRSWLCFVALGALAGCSTEPKWPAPKRTAEIHLRSDRREPIATVALGDALHIVFPPPSHPGTQWLILLLNTHILRQMTLIKPSAEGPPGAWEVTFQAIKVTGRTTVKFGAIDPTSKDQKVDDIFTLSIGIPREASGLPPSPKP